MCEISKFHKLVETLSTHIKANIKLKEVLSYLATLYRPNMMHIAYEGSVGVKLLGLFRIKFLLRYFNISYLEHWKKSMPDTLTKLNCRVQT